MLASTPPYILSILPDLARAPEPPIAAPLVPSCADEPTGWRGRVAPLLLLVAAALIGCAGIISQPLDGHEVLVVQTAKEMSQRGDWVLPMFNGEPRLKKPPLSYWLTGAVADIAKGDQTLRVERWHARAVSAIAGVLLVGITYLLGRRLFGWRVGVLGAAVLMTSYGFFEYARNARPEMLYAMLCTAGFAAFVEADAATSSIRRHVAAHSMWVCLALATLAKGPHVPAMLLAGMGVFLLVERVGGRRWIATMAPLTGPLILAAIAGSWWWLVNQRLVAEFGGNLAGSELTGSRLDINPLALLSPYYLYATPQLLLPWVVLMPALAALRWRGGGGAARSGRMIVFLIVAAIVAFNVGEHRRSYYMLPLLGPLALLLAAGAAASIDRFAGFRRTLGSVKLVALIGLGIAAAWIVMPRPDAVADANVISAVSAVVLALVVAIAWWRLVAACPQAWPGWTLAAIAFMLWSLLFAVGVTGAGRSPERFERVRLAMLIDEVVGDHTPLIAFGADPNLAVYYTRNPIRELRSADELVRYVAAMPDRRALVLVSHDWLRRIPDGLNVQRVFTMVVPDLSDADGLVELSLDPHYEPPAASTPDPSHGATRPPVHREDD